MRARLPGQTCLRVQAKTKRRFLTLPNPAGGKATAAAAAGVHPRVRAATAPDVAAYPTAGYATDDPAAAALEPIRLRAAAHDAAAAAGLLAVAAVIIPAGSDEPTPLVRAGTRVQRAPRLKRGAANLGGGGAQERMHQDTTSNESKRYPGARLRAIAAGLQKKNMSAHAACA